MVAPKVTGPRSRFSKQTFGEYHAFWGKPMALMTHETVNSYAFLDKFAIAEGHTQIIPKCNHFDLITSPRHNSLSN